MSSLDSYIQDSKDGPGKPDLQRGLSTSINPDKSKHHHHHHHKINRTLSREKSRGLRLLLLNRDKNKWMQNRKIEIEQKSTKNATQEKKVEEIKLLSSTQIRNYLQANAQKQNKKVGALHGALDTDMKESHLLQSTPRSKRTNSFIRTNVVSTTDKKSTFLSYLKK